MKKIFFALVMFAAAAAFSACDKEPGDYGSQTAPNFETRAAALGFESVDEYTTYVRQQCALGNHQNCDRFIDGTCQPCGYVKHSGQRCDGTHHNGMDHGQHNGSGGHHHNGWHH